MGRGRGTMMRCREMMGRSRFTTYRNGEAYVRNVCTVAERSVTMEPERPTLR